jgi:hypothetical protein
MRVAATLLILTLVACGGQEQTSSTNSQTQQRETASAPANITPEELGELGAKIQKEPARADQILAEKGLTQESFEKAIRDVTESAEASKRYAESYKRVSG